MSSPTYFQVMIIELFSPSFPYQIRGLNFCKHLSTIRVLTVELLRVNISPPHSSLHCSLKCCIVVFDIPMLARSTNIFFSICKYRGKRGQGHILSQTIVFLFKYLFCNRKIIRKKYFMDHTCCYQKTTNSPLLRFENFCS